MLPVGFMVMLILQFFLLKDSIAHYPGAHDIPVLLPWLLSLSQVIGIACIPASMPRLIAARGKWHPVLSVIAIVAIIQGSLVVVFETAYLLSTNADWYTAVFGPICTMSLLVLTSFTMALKDRTMT